MKMNLNKSILDCFKHILVSEVGTASTILSTSLEHTNLQTANVAIDKLVSNKIQ